jgi:hypothetical protein
VGRAAGTAHGWVRPEKANVADVALAKNVERAVELPSIDPALVAEMHFAAREIAEIAGSVAGVGDSDVTEGRSAAAQETQHVPGFLAAVFIADTTPKRESLSTVADSRKLDAERRRKEGGSTTVGLWRFRQTSVSEGELGSAA